MEKLSYYNRRDFVKLSATGAMSALPIMSSASGLLTVNEPEQPHKIFIFSKTLQFLEYEEMSAVVKKMGFDGIDLTVRPKGHVLPENVARDLPIATKIMKKSGLLTGMISTSVIDSNNPIDIKVLDVASKLGYSLYRTGWLKYPKDRGVEESLILYKKQLQALSVLNTKLGIVGAYQNHSGNYFGAPVWDLNQVFSDVSLKNLGIQYDIMHSTVEGGQSWQLGLELVKEHINSLVIKDFKWVEKNGKWKREYTPLGEGMVDFESYFKLLKQYKINLPISLHFEYDLGGAEKGKIPTIERQLIYDKMQKDLQFLKKLLKEYFQ